MFIRRAVLSATFHIVLIDISYFVFNLFVVDCLRMRSLRPNVLENTEEKEFQALTIIHEDSRRPRLHVCDTATHLIHYALIKCHFFRLFNVRRTIRLGYNFLIANER